MEEYAVVETEENEKVCVTGTPKRWIINDVLYWPNTLIVDRENPKDPVKGVWSEHSFVMLKDNLSNFWSNSSHNRFVTINFLQDHMKKRFKRRNSTASTVIQNQNRKNCDKNL